MDRRTILCCLLLLAAHAAASAAAIEDFGQHLVGEQAVEPAVDLNAAHSADDAEANRDMESLLHWAIEHSDPEKLKRDAQAARTQAVKEFVDKQKRVRELTDHVTKQMTETDMIKVRGMDLAAALEQLAILRDSSSDAKQLTAALTKLQVLVEPIDNANDLKPLAGIAPLVSMLGHASSSVQEAAAYALGTAAANNEKFQSFLLEEHPSVVSQLLKVAALDGEAAAGAANKALYALGSLVRIMASAREAFYGAGGMSTLLRLMNSPTTPARVKTKSINLASDLLSIAAAPGPEGTADGGVGTWDSKLLEQFASAALDLLGLASAEGDLQRQETALLAMRQLLQLRGMAGKEALEEAGAEGVLREVLTQLELAGEEVEGEEQLQHADALEGRAGEKKWDFNSYVTHLCAEVLHYVSIDHEEL